MFCTLASGILGAVINQDPDVRRGCGIAVAVLGSISHIVSRWLVSCRRPKRPPIAATAAPAAGVGAPAAGAGAQANPPPALGLKGDGLAAIVIMLHLALTATSAVLGGVVSRTATETDGGKSSAIGLAITIVGFLSHITSWQVFQYHMRGKPYQPAGALRAQARAEAAATATQEARDAPEAQAAAATGALATARDGDGGGGVDDL